MVVQIQARMGNQQYARKDANVRLGRGAWHAWHGIQPHRGAELDLRVVVDVQVPRAARAVDPALASRIEILAGSRVDVVSLDEFFRV